MSRIKVFSGGERERSFVRRGDSIVDFLADPLKPCFVYSHTKEHTFDFRTKRMIALNYGNFREAHRFKSFVGDLDESPEELHMRDQLVDDKVLVFGTRADLNFYMHTEKVFGQNGFCELIYFGSANDIVREFVNREYTVYEFFPERLEEGKRIEALKRWDYFNSRWQEQRRNNLQRREKEFNNFYQRRLL